MSGPGDTDRQRESRQWLLIERSCHTRTPPSETEINSLRVCPATALLPAGARVAYKAVPDEDVEPGGESQREILAAVAAAGYEDLTAPKLGRLHRAKLIPKPSVRRLGRARGTVSEFPAGTLTRLLRVLSARRQHRTLRATAWHLWWEDGGELSPLARELVDQVARDFDRVRRFLGNVLEREEAWSPAAERRMDELYEAAQRSRLEGALAAARRRVGMAAFSTVTRTLAEIGTGRFKGFDECDVTRDGTPYAETTAALLEKALGLDRARVDALAEAPPWYQGRSEDDFVRLSTLLADPIGDVAQAPDQVLEEARVEVRAFLTTILNTAAITKRLFGGSAFGFGILARALNATKPDRQAMLLLAWLTLRTDPELRPGMRELAELAPRAEAWLALQGILDQLRVEVPGMANALTDKNIGAALRSSAAAERLAAQLAKARQQHEAAIAAFFERHPEVDPLMQAAAPPDRG